MFNAVIFVFGTIHSIGKYRLCIAYLLNSSDLLIPNHPEPHCVEGLMLK